MDRLGADFEFAVGTIVDKLNANPVIMQLPIGAEAEFRGLIDLLEMKAYVYDEGNNPTEPKEVEIPQDMLAKAQQARQDMIEKIAETDDDVMEKFLEDQEIGIEEEVADYQQSHLNSIVKGDPEPGFGRVDIKEDLRKWFGKGKKGGAGGGGWDRYNTKGERIGKCGDSKKGEGKPKCLTMGNLGPARS